MSPLRREWGVGEDRPRQNNSHSVLGVVPPTRNVNTHHRRPSSHLNMPISRQPIVVSSRPTTQVARRVASSELGVATRNQQHHHNHHRSHAPLVPNYNNNNNKYNSSSNGGSNSFVRSNHLAQIHHHRQHHHHQPVSHSSNWLHYQHQAPPTYPPPPPYSTIPRPPQRHSEIADYNPSLQTSNSSYRNHHHRQKMGVPAQTREPRMHKSFTTSCADSLYNQGFDGTINPVNPYPGEFDANFYTNDEPPSPSSVDIETFGESSFSDPNSTCCGSSTLFEAFIKLYAIISLVFPPTGIGAVICAFTASSESSYRFKTARQKVSLILASVSFAIAVLIIVVVIVATQVMH